MKHFQNWHKKFVICTPILPSWYIIEVVLLDVCNLIQSMTFSQQFKTTNNNINQLLALLHDQLWRIKTTVYSNLRLQWTYGNWHSGFSHDIIPWINPCGWKKAGKFNYSVNVCWSCFYLCSHFGFYVLLLLRSSLPLEMVSLKRLAVMVAVFNILEKYII